MSQIAVEKAESKRVALPTHVQGSTFFALMAGLWGSFVTLLAASPESLAQAYDWLTGLPIVWEILMWIVTLPWTAAYLVYEATWAHWLRVLVVAFIVVVHLSITAPRGTRSNDGV